MLICVQIQYLKKKVNGDNEMNLLFFDTQLSTNDNIYSHALCHSWICTDIKICQYATEKVKNYIHTEVTAMMLEELYMQQSWHLYCWDLDEQLQNQTQKYACVKALKRVLMFFSFYNDVLQVIWSGHMCKDSENDMMPCTDVWLMWIKLNRKVWSILSICFSTN